MSGHTGKSTDLDHKHSTFTLFWVLPVKSLMRSYSNTKNGGNNLEQTIWNACADNRLVVMFFTGHKQKELTMEVIGEKSHFSLFFSGLLTRKQKQLYQSMCQWWYNMSGFVEGNPRGVVLTMEAEKHVWSHKIISWWEQTMMCGTMRWRVRWGGKKRMNYKKKW